MQTASARLKNALLTDVSVKALPSLLAEWNHNRYAELEKVDSFPSESGEDQEKDSFPITSIVEPNRPTRGVIKGRTSGMSVGYNWRTRTTKLAGNEGFAAPRYSDRPEDVRYYTTGPDSIYKYWASHIPSSKTLTGGYYPFGQTLRQEVIYDHSVWTNKLVIGLENTWASPANYSVQVTTDGSTWTTVSTNPAINSKGQIVLYLQSGSWGATVTRGNHVQIRGLRLVSNGMNKPDSFLNVIEVSARLEKDLSEYVISYETSFTMSEANMISPLGTASSNEASVALSNVTGIFDGDDPDGLYYGLMEKNILMTMDIVYHFDDGYTEAIREFTMYVDEWGEPGQAEIEANLKDYSKFMQSQPCPPQLLENITAGEAIWRLCDSIGFVDYNYERRDHEAPTNINYFYTNSEDMVWDVFQSVAESTQTAVYFDEYGVLQVQTKESAYDKYNDPVWTFQYENKDGRLGDIEEQNQTSEFEANVVDITYRTTKITDYANGWPKMEVVWEPETSFVLRASNLVKNLAVSDEDYIQINPAEGKVWPYEGMLVVGGELIKYKGKHYNYYPTTGGVATIDVYSQAEKDNVDRNLSDPTKAYKNDFTGYLRIVERGVYWTKPREHTIAIPNFSSEYFWHNTNVGSGSWGINGGIIHDPHKGVVSLKTDWTFPNGNKILRAVTGEPGYTQVYNNYGTRMRIPKANGPVGGGGIFFFGGDGNAGYYVELLKTEIFDVPGGPQRELHGNEVGFFIRRADGSFERPVESVPMQITADKWYDIDIEWRQGPAVPAGDYRHDIRVFVNGVKVFDINLSSGRVSRSGKFGFFVRGNNKVDYEYLYAHDKNIESGMDDMTTYDRIRGGWASDRGEREFFYGDNMDQFLLTGKEVSPTYDERTRFYFQEFGPVVHEVREMDIPFNKGPVAHSKFFTTNDSQVVMPWYRGTPYSAKFLLINASRNNAVLQGEDLLTLGEDNPVDQRTFIYGRLVYQEDEQTKTVKDEDSIRARGKIETQFDGQWIQSEEEAEKLGDWVLSHWALGSDEVSLTAFGNPLIQLGDLVYIDNPTRHMSPETHRYFVVGISSSFDNGLSTNFTLRRSKV